LATSGDLHLATSGDFNLATDTQQLRFATRYCDALRDLARSIRR